MQREVVRLLKKHLHEGYDDHQFEYSILTPFEIMAEDWTQLSLPASDEKIRGLARDLIATIRGVDEADLYIIPKKDRVVRFLRDVLPQGIFRDEAEEVWWAEEHADFLIKELRQVHQLGFWRGKRIREE